MIIDADGKKRFFERGSTFVELVTGKEKTFQSRAGLTFWFDINSRCARTSDVQIFLYFYENPMHGPIGTFPILHIHGRAICFTRRRRSEKEGNDAVRPGYGKDGQTYWELGDMGLSLHQKDLDQSFVYHPLTNAAQFRSFEEQELAMTLMEDILSKISGDWVGIAHGKPQSATVIFTSEFQEKLQDGTFVEGGVQ